MDECGAVTGVGRAAAGIPGGTGPVTPMQTDLQVPCASAEPGTCPGAASAGGTPCHPVDHRSRTRKATEEAFFSVQLPVSSIEGTSFMASKPSRATAGKPTRAPAKKKQPAAVETSETIAEQTSRFLKSGNEIQYIQSGISGQPSMAVNKHIKLGNKSGARSADCTGPAGSGRVPTRQIIPPPQGPYRTDGHRTAAAFRPGGINILPDRVRCGPLTGRTS